jgi:hypothetical protein
MSFAALRQKCLQAHALGNDRYAEDLTLTSTDGEERVVRAKVTHSQIGSPGTGKTAGAMLESTFEELERIEVLVSRDVSYAKSLPTRPQPGTGLNRDESLDDDGRPFSFAGEVVYEGDQHAVYIFQRPRRIVQGRAMG